MSVTDTCPDCDLSFPSNTDDLVAHYEAVHLHEPMQIPNSIGPLSSTIPDPQDPSFGDPPLPPWVTEFRPNQWEAIEETVALFQDGIDIVWLDAPTGSGKTLIGETARRILGKKSLYVCSGKSLQDQFVNDFPYAEVLKGKGNYPTQLKPFPEFTCSDCTKKPGMEDCAWCSEPGKCKYQVAKQRVMGSNLGVINTSYMLAESNYVGAMSGRPFVILDECDMLEQELMGFVEFALTSRMMDNLGIVPPGKGSHKETIVKWMTEKLMPAIEAALKWISPDTKDVRELRKRNAIANLKRDAARMVHEFAADNWVRDNKAGPLVMKPVRVDGYGERVLWKHAQKWLAMSATIISPDEMADSLGIGDRKWDVVSMPMTFPKENRQIHVAGVAKMAHREKQEAYPRMARAVRKIVDAHPHDRILVHTVSYELAQYLVGEVGGDRGLTYRTSAERDGVIEKYRSQDGAVLYAPSLDRGVDFKDDDCRVVIVAKVPFPSLGDTQVSERLHAPGGKTWYAVQTVRSLVQMTGRGVRNKDDHCVTYILDSQFMSNIWKNNRSLLPNWWKEALDMRYDARWLMRD